MVACGRIAVDGATGIIDMSGDFDMSNASELRRCLDTFSSDALIVLDMKRTTFIDSTVLSAIAVTLKRGVRVSVWNASPAVEKVLTVSGVSELLGHPGDRVGNEVSPVDELTFRLADDAARRSAG
jgi:anti-anti-sigma factor